MHLSPPCWTGRSPSAADLRLVPPPRRLLGRCIALRQAGQVLAQALFLALGCIDVQVSQRAGGAHILLRLEVGRHDAAGAGGAAAAASRPGWAAALRGGRDGDGFHFIAQHMLQLLQLASGLRRPAVAGPALKPSLLLASPSELPDSSGSSIAGTCLRLRGGIAAAWRRLLPLQSGAAWWWCAGGRG